MSILRDEMGSLVTWRVVAATVGAIAVTVAVACAVAMALGGGKADGQDEPGDDATATPAERQSAGRERDGDGSSPSLARWLARVEGSELLAGLADEELEGLKVAAELWSREAFAGEDVSWRVPREPQETERGTSVYLLATTADDASWAVAQLSPDGSWGVTRLVEVVEGVNDGEAPPQGEADGTILVSQVSELSRVMSENVATEVSRQLLDSGIENASAAWTTADAVTSEDGVTRLVIWTPVYIGQGEDAIAWDVRFDEEFGMLEISATGDAV